jgi:nitroreductase
MRDLIDLARQTPSGNNRQPLKYVISCQPEMNKAIYRTIAWAASLPEWDGPDESERPTGYVVILNDNRIGNPRMDNVGIAAQTILLGAVSMGLGGCMFGSVKRSLLKDILALEDHLEVQLVISLGKPVEKIVLKEAQLEGSVTYYRDPDQTHYVPKRSLSEVIVQEHTP